MADAPFALKDANLAAKSVLTKDNGDGTVSPYHAEDATQRAALITALAPLAVLAARLAATAWTVGTTAQDVRAYADVEVQIAGLSGGDTITFTRSVNGTDYVTATYFADTATGTVINANGIYGLAGFGYLKWAKTGSASTPTVTIRGSN